MLVGLFEAAADIFLFVSLLQLEKVSLELGHRMSRHQSCSQEHACPPVITDSVGNLDASVLSSHHTSSQSSKNIIPLLQREKIF